MIHWNPQLKLILADVDETLADVYTPATPKMAAELASLLEDRITLFLVSGGGLHSIRERITNLIQPAALRHHILIAHCNGAEVWGFDEQGVPLDKPYYSLYEERLSPTQKTGLREVVAQLVKEFGFHTHPTMPKKEFLRLTAGDPLQVMMVDRGPQITFELVNAYDMSPEQAALVGKSVPLTHGAYDLRIPFIERAEELLRERGIPITPRLGGNCAVDLAVEGVSKTTAVRHVLEDPNLLSTLGLDPAHLLAHPETMEVWGDKFSAVRGGADRHISEGLPKAVRSLDFRNEDPQEFLPGYNTVVWDGEGQLHEGALEYMRSRH